MTINVDHETGSKTVTLIFPEGSYTFELANPFDERLTTASVEALKHKGKLAGYKLLEVHTENGSRVAVPLTTVLSLGLLTPAQ